jgi:ABC-type protease/lipase transport system fused ATPase/permease subunit
MRELSKGTSQKVAVAQALLGRPGLLVMDEAWTGLDAGARGGLAGLRAVGGVVAAGPGWVRVRAGESDNLLRWLLAAEGDVHVERVAAE